MLRIAAHKGKLRKLAKNVHLQKMSILKTVELDFSKPGLPENITLVDLLNDLVCLSGKQVLLIIDEAQHALITRGRQYYVFHQISSRSNQYHS